MLLALYRSPKEVTRLFQRQDEGERDISSKKSEWDEDPDFEWHAEMDRGEVTWRGWRATFVRERAFLEGGSWQDATRVNLSQGGRFLVLHVIWPPGSEGSEDVLDELLAAVAVLDAAPGATPDRG